MRTVDVRLIKSLMVGAEGQKVLVDIPATAPKGYINGFEEWELDYLYFMELSEELELKIITQQAEEDIFSHMDFIEEQEEKIYKRNIKQKQI